MDDLFKSKQIIQQHAAARINQCLFVVTNKTATESPIDQNAEKDKYIKLGNNIRDTSTLAARKYQTVWQIQRLTRTIIMFCAQTCVC